MRTIRMQGLILALSLAGAAPLAAQQSHIVPGTEIEAAVVEHAERAEADRETIRGFLERPEVQEIAERHGIDLDEVDAAVSSLGGDRLQQVASQVRTLDAALQDRMTISLTTTAIIVILLLVILLVVIT